jgi:hypothetical protein
MDIKRETVHDKNAIKGSYTLVLFGNRHGDDFETVAFLDSEADALSFKPFSNEYNYTVKKHFKGDRALRTAIDFVRSHEASKGVRISRIADRQAGILGYEVRPLYRDLRFRTSDPLNVHYTIKDTNLLIYIDLKDTVKRMLKNDRFDE